MRLIASRSMFSDTGETRVISTKWIGGLALGALVGGSLLSKSIEADQVQNSETGKSIQFPAAYEYPMTKGPGYETVLKCQMCHSLGYILNQGKQSRAFWNKTTHKMVDVYKAPISHEDEKIIVDYLFSYYGNGEQ